MNKSEKNAADKRIGLSCFTELKVKVTVDKKKKGMQIIAKFRSFIQLKAVFMSRVMPRPNVLRLHNPIVKRKIDKLAMTRRRLPLLKKIKKETKTAKRMFNAAEIKAVTLYKDIKNTIKSERITATRTFSRVKMSAG